MEYTNSDLNSVSVSIRKMISNLAAFPRIHMLSASFSPFIADTDYYKFDHSVDKITESVLSPNNYMIDFDETNNKSVGAMLSYWGDVAYSDIVKTFPSTKEKLNLWEMTPTGILCSATNYSLCSFDEEKPVQRWVGLLNNTTSISKVLERISSKWELLMNKCAYLWWYK